MGYLPSRKYSLPQHRSLDIAVLVLSPCNPAAEVGNPLRSIKFSDYFSLGYMQ